MRPTPNHTPPMVLAYLFPPGTRARVRLGSNPEFVITAGTITAGDPPIHRTLNSDGYYVYHLAYYTEDGDRACVSITRSKDAPEETICFGKKSPP